MRIRTERIKRRRPSPAMGVAVLSLIVALAGTAAAGGILTKKSAKRLAGRVAADKITERAPGLSVASASTAGRADSATAAGRADTLDGLDSGDLFRAPSGSTLRGTWRVEENATTNDGDSAVLISLPAPARAACCSSSTVVNLAEPPGSDQDSSCTGGPQNPTAPAGKVCIYVDDATPNVTSLTGFTSPDGVPPTHFSFEIVAAANTSGADDSFEADGTWAYTVP